MSGVNAPKRTYFSAPSSSSSLISALTATAHSTVKVSPLSRL